MKKNQLFDSLKEQSIYTDLHRLKLELKSDQDYQRLLEIQKEKHIKYYNACEMKKPNLIMKTEQERFLADLQLMKNEKHQELQKLKQAVELEEVLIKKTINELFKEHND